VGQGGHSRLGRWTRRRQRHGLGGQAAPAAHCQGSGGVGGPEDFPAQEARAERAAATVLEVPQARAERGHRRHHRGRRHERHGWCKHGCGMAGRGGTSGVGGAAAAGGAGGKGGTAGTGGATGTGALAARAALAARPELEETGGSTALAATPPMGWNSWNTFGCNPSDSLIRAIADAMVSSGMAAAGYVYVNIDDCWMNGRDPAGICGRTPPNSRMESQPWLTTCTARVSSSASTNTRRRDLCRARLVRRHRWRGKPWPRDRGRQIFRFLGRRLPQGTITAGGT